MAAGAQRNPPPLRPFDTTGAMRGAPPPIPPEPRRAMEPDARLWNTAVRRYDWLTFRSGIELGGQAPRELRAWVTLRNRGPKPVRIEHGACSLHIRLWRDSLRRGQPAWRSELRKHPEYATRRVEYVCTSQLNIRLVAPGHTLSFDLRVPFAEVLHDSLPDGRYWATLELQLVNDSLRPPEWERNYTFPVGPIVLRRAPDPVPSRRTVGALTYEAASSITRGTTPAGDTARFFMLVTNRGRRSARLAIPRGHPFAVYAHRTIAAFDSTFARAAWYRGDWLGDYQFELGPGQKWLFEIGEPLAELRSALGHAGTYHFRIFMTTGATAANPRGSPQRFYAGSLEVP